MSTPPPKLLRALAGETLERPPIWFMRQAGRSLPEYRELRSRAKDFIAFCLDPEMAAEATLQPMRRFPMDGAIVFADILLIPLALGQDVWFEAGEGPKLGELPPIEALRDQVEASTGRLSAVGETLARVRAELEPDRALIGFAGAPWTVATYMLERKGSEREAARAYAYAHPDELDALLDVLVDATARYLVMQAKAGAQALKLFESWAESLSEDVFERIVVRPHAAIVEKVRAAGVTVPIIGFPRGAGAQVETYAEGVPVEGIALDVQATAALGRRLQAQGRCIQGALDNLLLREGGPALDARVDQLLAQWGDGPWIFNLGHGVLPDTPIENIARVVSRVTGKPVR
ncbi:uroporphyrinogen decarboxylase [Phenylobacterium zucineum HLK1]|uniref:Uroporphyrinogen decarboxylase n=1 Tax=Phenylobacterium zucineum (strain HLK1) TaxID=450851 RepID=DCUP_PHEZH|nr:uroporphyrinogen decarboxylase [Phenylobacterium zucineum]B4RD11.1 RecName: Full=Uroporphyrinogen decarboxylase; Short=UPD; Short=URO-D [Phenylobacterium zucineum HLK1]ACG79943.1 uroporphyrinogen decarboxylase [Phenylobacterium zucineum HLK1]